MSKEQIAWCRTVGETLARTGGGRPVPALAFQHIIVPEVYNTFTQVRDKGVEGAFEGRGVGAGRWYTADAPAVTGELLEAPCRPITQTVSSRPGWRPGMCGRPFLPTTT